jgi:hypothetical protein
MSDSVYVLTKEVDCDPGEVMAVFDSKPSLQALELYFSSQDELDGIYETPDDEKMKVLYEAHYTNMGWGHYSIERFYIRAGEKSNTVSIICTRYGEDRQTNREPDYVPHTGMISTDIPDYVP